MKKVGGGSVTDSFLVKGVAFKKTFSYAGFEQQPKSFDNPDILLLNVELELKSEKVGVLMKGTKNRASRGRWSSTRESKEWGCIQLHGEQQVDSPGVSFCTTIVSDMVINRMTLLEYRLAQQRQ